MIKKFDFMNFNCYYIKELFLFVSLRKELVYKLRKELVYKLFSFEN